MSKRLRRNSPESVKELRMLHNKVKQTSKITDLRKRMGEMLIAIKLPLEEYLRNKGVSSDGTHHHSTFLALNGDYIGGGQKHKSHTDQLKPYLPKQKSYPYNPQGFMQKMNDEEEQLGDFMKKTGYVRVLNSSYLSKIRGKNDPHKLTFDINTKLTSSQLKSIKQTEELGHDVSGSINRGKTMFGYREIAAEHARVFNPQNIGKVQSALITPLPLKKKKPRVIRKIEVREAMINLHPSADDTIDNFSKYLQVNHNVEGVSGVYDPIKNVVLDARIPEHVDRLHELFGKKQLVGFNSITDTRLGKETNTEKIRQQLKEIEGRNSEAVLGFDEGSLEAVEITRGRNEQEILDKLLDHQNSTGILYPDRTFKIIKNPKYKKE